MIATRRRHSLWLLIAALLFIVGSAPLHAAPLAPIPIDGSTAYTQDFNTLASTGTSSTLPDGWAFLESGSSANTSYSAGTGSINTGDTYSFGAASSTERALGGLLSGSLIPTIGAEFVNDSGGALASLTISYTGEQWRLGATGRADRLDFQYSLNATSLNTGTWVDVDALDFTSPTTTSPTGALDGNSAANRTMLSHSITGLSIPAESTFWIRWTDFNASGSDDGLAVDDFTISGGPLAVTLASFDATLRGDGTTRVRWETVSELDTLGFHLWRAADESAPVQRLTAEMLPAQGGGGGQGATYEWVDASAGGTAFYYWLEDIDTSGVSTMHGPVLAQPEVPTAVTLATFEGHAASLALPFLALGALTLGAGLVLRRRA